MHGWQGYMITYGEEYMKSPREVYRKGSESSDAHFYYHRQVQVQGKEHEERRKKKTHALQNTAYELHLIRVRVIIRNESNSIDHSSL